MLLQSCTGKIYNTKNIHHYVITGIDVYGKRFVLETSSPVHMRGINLKNGSKWAVINGKRRLLFRAHN